MTASRVGSDRHFRARFEQSSLAQAVTDLDLRLTAVNNAMCELLGRSAVELVGMHVDDLAHPSGSPSRARELLHDTSRHDLEYERVYERPDGTIVPARLIASLVADDEGRPHSIASFVVDLSAQKQAEYTLAERERFFRALLERASDVAVVNAPDGTVLYANATVAQFGYTPEQVLGSAGFDFVHPEDRQAIQEAFDRVEQSPDAPVSLQYRHRHADGGFRWVESWISNKVDDPAIGGIVVNLRDVTARVDASRALRESEERYRAIVETAQEGIWVASLQGRTTYVNQKVVAMTGRSCDELYASSLVELLDAEMADGLLQRLEAPRIHGIAEYELPYVHPDGQQRWFLVRSSPLTDGTGEPVARLAMLSDITEVKRIEETLRRHALHDELTGLANRTLLQDRLDQAAGRHQGDAGTMAAVALDVDGFALVNESLGHAAGDDLLVQIAGRLQRSAHPGDTVARSGGDEFVVLKETVASEPLELVERVMADLREPFDVGGHQVRITASAGIATSDLCAPIELVGAAGAALRAAKQRGADNAEVFDPDRAGEARARFELSLDLVEALEHDRLELHYQPIVELTSGRLLGIEALARWHHRTRGWIPPDVFVAAAEQSGLACQLDRWVLQRATADLARLRAEELVADDVYVSINISALHLTQGDLEAVVDEAVWLSGLPPACVALEVTETAVIADPKDAAGILQAVVAKGFSVSLDDFGTGYSGLTRLQTLPVARLKIDRCFVGNLATDADDLAICASVVDLCRALGVVAIAEGVETKEQLDLLQRLGCHAAQGYLWSKPLSTVDLGQVLSSSDHFDVEASAHVDTPARALSRATAEHGLTVLLRLHREGASLRTIAAALNSQDFRTPRGTRWHPSSVAAVIADHAYPDLWKRAAR
jgi:diguanylate cyclase (GGDEF)-like protein/PAS domain S-box-containing protein